MGHLFMALTGSAIELRAILWNQGSTMNLGAAKRYIVVLAANSNGSQCVENILNKIANPFNKTYTG